jgi:hypothetical protein
MRKKLKILDPLIHPKLSPAGKVLKEAFMKMGLEWCAEEILFLRQVIKTLEKPKPVRKGLVPTAVIDEALERMSRGKK